MKLGLTVKDTITGFEGVCTGHCVYISGCDQLLVQPKAEGKDFKEPRWFDRQRLILVDGVEEIVLNNADTPGSDVPAPTR